MRTWISSAAVDLARSRAYHINKAQYKCVTNLVNLDLNLAIHRQFMLADQGKALRQATALE